MALSPVQWTFIAGSVAYPASFYLFLPPNPTPARFAKSREAISFFHCSLMSLLSLACIKYNPIRSLLAAPSEQSKNTAPVPDSQLPIITTKSTFANALTALETAYLLQDSVVLFYASRLHRQVGNPTKGLNIKHLAWHHAGLSCAFGVLQWYIYQGREKGILIILLMMLMNASSPFGTIRWYLMNFRPDWRRAIALSTVMYLAAYAWCRVWLIYYILKVFGTQKGHGALRTFLQLRWQCQTGTGIMAAVNSTWLIMGVQNFIRRSVSSLPVGKKRN